MNLIQWGRKYIDYRIGFFGCVVMSLLVFGVNYRETAETLGQANIVGSLTAAIKQGVFTFFFGGVVMRFSERLATEIEKLPLALISACILPSALSLILTFGLHSLKGTPEPLMSIIPTAILIIPGTAFWGVIHRRKKDALEKKLWDN
jgi:uncharacterized protein YacL